MNQKLKFIIKLLFLTVIAVISYRYISGHLDEFKKISQIDWQQFIILSVVALAGFVVYGLLFKILLWNFGAKLKFSEWFGLTMLGSYSNYLFIRGSTITKGLYLKKHHGLPYAGSVVIFAFLYLTQILCASFMALFGIMFNFLTFFISCFAGGGIGSPFPFARRHFKAFSEKKTRPLSNG